MILHSGELFQNEGINCLHLLMGLHTAQANRAMDNGPRAGPRCPP